MLISFLVRIVEKFSSFNNKIPILKDPTLYINCFYGCEVVFVRIVKKFFSFNNKIPSLKDLTLYKNCFCGCEVVLVWIVKKFSSFNNKIPILKDPTLLRKLLLRLWGCPCHYSYLDTSCLAMLHDIVDFGSARMRDPKNSEKGHVRTTRNLPILYHSFNFIFVDNIS